MELDANPAMIESMRLEKQGNLTDAHRIRDDFTAQLREEAGTGFDFCSCRVDCPYHGRCMECVAIHRGHVDHVPNCLKAIPRA